MKRPAVIADTLNELLAAEFAAEHQYRAHAGWAAVAEYAKLAGIFQEHADQERGHAGRLIERLYQIEASPVVDRLDAINLGADVGDRLQFDLAAELAAIRRYNAAIEIARENGDNATRAILEEILADEEHHASEFTRLLEQIQAMTLANWLSVQV